MTKPVKSFRIDKELLDKADKLKIDLTLVVEAAIAQAIKDNRCPYCKSPLKKKT